MARCKSGDGCREQATVGLSNPSDPLWCEAHAEALRRVRQSFVRERKPEPAQTAPKVDRDAERRAVAIKIAQAVHAGTTAQLWAAVGVAQTSAIYRSAISHALGWGWIERESGLGFKPGNTKPPDPEGDAIGRLPLEVRLERLVAHVKAADGPVMRPEAAHAAGYESAGGSVQRVIALAKKRGLLKSDPNTRGLLAA